MRRILVAVGIALAVSILLTPALIQLFTRQGFGHGSVRTVRRATTRNAALPRWAASRFGRRLGGYLGTHLVGMALDGEGPSASGLLILGLATALGGVGFVDDLIKSDGRETSV